MAPGRVSKFSGFEDNDTIIGCDECGEQETYTNDGSVPHDEFVRWALAEFDSTHECGAEDTDEEQE